MHARQTLDPELHHQSHTILLVGQERSGAKSPGSDLLQDEVGPPFAQGLLELCSGKNTADTR
jgi:hypothetical protein